MWFPCNKKLFYMRFMQWNVIIKFLPVWTQWFSEDGGEGAEFKRSFILILTVHPIPFQLLLVLSSLAIFSPVRPGNMQIQHCTSKWFYLLKKAVHVLRIYSMLILSLHSAEFAQQNGSDFRDNAEEIWRIVPQQNKSKYFFHVQLPRK